jgi:hypothetical protein
VVKRSELGTLVCDYCDRKVQKVHPAQIICGRRECRNASKRKYYGVTFVCDSCGNDAPRTRSNQRFCSSAACQAVSKKGKRAPKIEVTCLYCKTTVVARNTRQVTCGSDECKATRRRLMTNNARPRKRTGDVVQCRFCEKTFTRIAENHVTCGAPACRKARKKERDSESFWLGRRRNPVLCGVCDQPIKVKRLRYHPNCRKRLANDKKRLKRQRARIAAEKDRKLANRKYWSRSTDADRPVFRINLSRV